MSASGELVKRLRANNICNAFGIQSGGYFNPDGLAAADRIEALEAEIKSLNEAQDYWRDQAMAIDARTEQAEAQRDRLAEALRVMSESDLSPAEFRAFASEALTKEDEDDGTA